MFRPCWQVSGGVRTSPVSSPQASPVASRRSPSSYRPDRRLRRDKNAGDIDSGVYSANSSRDGTPVRGGHAAGDVVTPSGVRAVEVLPRTRSKAVSHSPKHRSSSSGSGSEQNGVHIKYNRYEVGEGSYLDKSTSRSKIDLASLNLVSKSIEHSSPEQRRSAQKSSSNIGDPVGGSGRSNLRVRRSSSDRPISPSRSKSVEQVERESKSLTRGGNKIRSLSPSPSSNSTLDSPEDIKLVS